MVGSAVGAWWLVTQQRARAAAAADAQDRGIVIFDNTPRASDVDAIV
jgi:hypothetical protein